MKLSLCDVRIFEFERVADMYNALDFLVKHPELLNDDTYLHAYEEFYYYKIKESDELIIIPNRKFKLLTYNFNCFVYTGPGGSVNEI